MENEPVLPRENLFMFASCGEERDRIASSDYVTGRKWAVYYDDMFRGYANYHLSGYSEVVEEQLPELRVAGLKRLLDRRFFDLEYRNRGEAGEYWTIELYRPDGTLAKEVQLAGFPRNLRDNDIGNLPPFLKDLFPDPYDRAYMYFKVLTQEIINLHDFPASGPMTSGPTNQGPILMYMG